MEDIKQLETDLGYVRSVVQKNEHDRSPAAIYLLWAAIVLVGFSLADFAPRSVGLFWMVAGPLGGVVSGLLGWRDQVRRGEVRSEIGLRWCLHWAGMLAIILLAVPLATTQIIPGDTFGRVILLVVALTYYLAGVHLERPLIGIGILLAAGYGALFFIKSHGWTLLGVLVALALVVTPFIGARKNVASAS